VVIFAAGALLGVTATFGSLLRQRREIARLRKQLARSERDRHAPPRVDAQAPDSL